ncbi:MAG: hypothetical protein NTZ56_10145 [Acidobacteria bacterium]|nr:hypothetical protein [Acidobacteriota bacterium]
MTRYEPSRNYLALGAVALVLGTLAGWMATRWVSAAVPAGVFFALAGLNFFLAFRPAIEVRNHSLSVGHKQVLWADVVEIRRTGWVSPLVIWLMLRDGSRELVIYPGALDASRLLMDDMARRLNRQPDMGYSASAPPVLSGEAIRGPLLNPDDEAEVERLFQRLKTVGHLEPNSTDEK